MDTNSFALWPIVPFGGEGEEGTGGSNDGGSQGDSGGAGGTGGSGGTEGKGGESGSKSTDSGSEGDDSDDDEYEGYSSKELKRMLKDKETARKTAEADAKKLRDKETEAQRKKNDDVTNLTNDVNALKDENATLRATVTKQAIIGAIRDDSRFDWFDPNMVAQQLDPEVVKVDDQGRVEGIKSQLTKVAKEHPFLLKKDNTNNGNGGQGNGQQNNGNGSGASGPTGFQPGQGGASNGGGETDRAKLAEDYPALASRI